METQDPNIIKAHTHSFKNRKQVLASKFCACFHCGEIFDPSRVNEWTDGPNEDQTALCPVCGIDAVIGDLSGYDIGNKQFLDEMKKYWFED